ncbi:hypothetical protein OHC33_011023 [Knufia fluminis]|uniref:DUF7923 domain-containing protein n=1 Tax=Knufia fluminis TaxID=191047 RepID=A0AAN8EDK9_9EURO|nr:hypothetical protein OHC33_011023 [Knufia fluminis]
MNTLRQQVGDAWEKYSSLRQSLHDDLLRENERLTIERDAAQAALEAYNHNKFVLVLIDGDGMLFQDEQIAQGIDGGENTERDLRDAITTYFASQGAYTQADNVLMRVFANLKGLGGTYAGAGIIQGDSKFRDFVLGFNKSHKFSEYIDAGNSKEAADSKIKATTQLFINNAHCKHIVLGICHDSGYSGFIGEYIRTPSQDKITMLESVPFDFHLKKNAENFGKLRIDRVFRLRPLPSAGKTPRPQSIVVDAHSTRQRSVPNGMLDPDHTRIIFQDKDGHRIDTKISWDPQTLQQLYADPYFHKLCNSFYLCRNCEADNCGYRHDAQLDSNQLNALKCKARKTKCNFDTCWNANCTSGHTSPLKIQWEREIYAYNVDTRKRIPVDKEKLTQRSLYG